MYYPVHSSVREIITLTGYRHYRVARFTIQNGAHCLSRQKSENEAIKGHLRCRNRGRRCVTNDQLKYVRLA